MLQIGNVRLGLATNSSSSHSLIFLGDREVVTTEDTDFGWAFFTAANRASKTNYFGLMLYQALVDQMDAALAQTITSQLVGIEQDWYHLGYVDHQSVWGFPFNFKRQHVHMQFATDAFKWLTENNIAVLGGNDNTELRHPLYDRTKKINYPLDDEGYGDLVARWDEQYQFWTIFNAATGGRMMFRFAPNGIDDSLITQSSVPMLVDISITDFCPFGCTFCYRGSTTEGQHASFGNIRSIVDHLAEMEVFEVALGGGEPTLHPSFLTILGLLHERHIVPNFTTKNLKWLYENTEWLKFGGSVAFSVNHDTQIDALVDLLRAKKIPHDKVKLHIVMGTVEQDMFIRMLSNAFRNNLDVTLLGYKDDHRGIEHKAHNAFYPYEAWLLPVLLARREESDLPRIAIDTPLAAQFEQQLLQVNIPKWMFHTQEGKFSMFVDAVNMTAARSSFGDVPQYKHDDFHYGNWIQKAYQSISKEV